MMTTIKDDDNTPQAINQMSDEFRRSIINRLPPMAPTRAPWADPIPGAGDDDEEEELADEVGDLGSRYVSLGSTSCRPSLTIPRFFSFDTLQITSSFSLFHPLLLLHM